MGGLGSKNGQKTGKCSKDNRSGQHT
jgi:hypothetical protein